MVCGGRIGFQIAQVLKRLGLQFVIIELAEGSGTSINK